MTDTLRIAVIRLAHEKPELRKHLLPILAASAGKYGYIAIYNGKQVEVWADTSYGAQQEAAKVLKVPPKKQYQISVHLADKGDGKPVVHLPLMASAKVAGRPLHEIANEIRKDWKPVNFAAKPYLEAMEGMNSIHDNYGMDSGQSIVAYFLSNARSWKGDVAKRIKLELKQLANGKSGSLDLPVLAEGAPDNLSPEEAAEWEKNTEKYKNVVKDQHKKAMEFPNEAALKKYLKEHPDADKSNHSVVENKGEDGSEKGEAEHVKPNKALGDLLSQWHSSANDPIYAVSSNMSGGHPVPRPVVEKALASVSEMLPKAQAGAHGWGKTEVAELTKAKGMMEKMLGK